MKQYQRIMIAFAIFLSGLVLVPQVSLGSPGFGWEQYTEAYEEVVTITRARYQNGELEVRATSSQGSAATLRVYRSSDRRYLGTLTYNSGEHRGKFRLSQNPVNITVVSSLGG